MYPSNSNGSCEEPINDHSFFHFVTDSKQEDPSFGFFNFPSPYYSQCELEQVFQDQDHDVFLHQHHDLLFHHEQNHQPLMADSVSGTIVNVPATSAVDCTKKKSNNHNADTEVKQQKRSSSKRDRHSKINTANGPRDRRMRLSLDVAREFFGLQDMLGYDKASRTVEWLLIQARHEIMKLARARVSHNNNNSVAAAAAEEAAAVAKSPSSTSEGEVVSALEGTISKGKPTEKTVKKTTFQFHPLARDLREKARARAKARTKAKNMWNQKLCCSTDETKLSSWWSFQTGEESSIQQHHHNKKINPSLQQVAAGDMIDESLAIINKWNPDSMFNCLQNSGINQEHQITGFLPFGKPWEGYNNKI
ncbi:hypothetical protein ES288_D12G309200v1 [Gossypium darwinii]|uniref:TCP domain-containing protein n=1 Tax=Gossypium darwinii TaxID=34276 RepID=A0A5D2AF80_GOSDA|nr:hypothetical protein ES288_D12G309200v1 [Gossypium darwinii]